MDKVARLLAQERSELFAETAAKKGITPAIAEKDFWVTWVLNCLFSAPKLKHLLILKGGTSLSKVYHLIDRFSEDIDLILDWRVLGGDRLSAERSKTKQAQLNATINDRAQDYIGGELLRLVKTALDSVCGCDVGTDDPFVINVNYPAAFPDDYIRSQVRLEISPLASWLPHEERSISCYATEHFPKVFE